MAAHVIAQTAGCTQGDCPTTYRTDDGRWFVQGRTLDAATAAGLGLPATPAHESYVEVSPSMVDQLRGGLA